MDQSYTSLIPAPALSETAPAVRHDGWTPARKALFLDHLANHGDVRAACRAVGLSREAAYRLRRRDAVFGRAWAAALVLASEAGGELLACRAINGVQEEIWHGGLMVGTRIRFDTRLLLAHFARLDQQAACETAREDATRFDELVALAAGAGAPPEDLVGDADGVPLPRQACVDYAVEAADGLAREDAAAARERQEQRGELADDDFGEAEEAAREALESLMDELRWQVGTETAAHWQAWVAEAHAAVDRLLAEDALAAGQTLSTVSTSRLAQAGSGGQP
jgi:hypothetical protein